MHTSKEGPMNRRKKELHDNQTISKEEGILEEAKLSRRNNLWKLGTWSVKSLAGKEEELVEKLEKIDAHVVGLTETKKEEKGEIVIKGDHLLIYSRVNEEKWGSEGEDASLRKSI
ncbi:hypothetical protein QE152_g27732 [Popillia japonica]|uniref:Uncharacterized protein n=1 Tax=Popillia japonica TaxID=7064 RepID=A0AAW1JSM8_POPJA